MLFVIINLHYVIWQCIRNLRLAMFFLNACIFVYLGHGALFFCLTAIYCYYAYGLDYAKGMVVYIRDNNKDLKEAEDCWHSIELEWEELIFAIKHESWSDVTMEFFDVLHSFIKYVLVNILPVSFYCSQFCWLIVFALVVPCGIKLGTRYHKNGCIRNHKGELMKHKCIHRPDFVFEK